MTTLIGIESAKKKGKRGIVLASDLRGTKTNWKPSGDVAYREQRAVDNQKIHINDNETLAFCMSGISDEYWRDFSQKLRLGKIKVGKALREGYFPELKTLNEFRWGGRVPDTSLFNAILIASRMRGSEGLYTCYPLGKVEQRAWTSIGSGSDYALEHIAKKSDNIPYYTSSEEALELAVESLDKASQDLHTGGLDIAFISKERIISFGNLIKEELDKAKERSLKRMKDSL
jgi:hypothetical protein|tara:strand:+ start:312 stop:1001 length:690 start_codon:yes stop_codon:yes gene_type:complete